EALRMYCVQHHYRSPSNFEVELDAAGRPVFPDLNAAARRLDYLYTTLRRIDDFLAVGKYSGEGEIAAGCDRLIPEVREALEDDFNAPVVLAAISEAART